MRRTRSSIEIQKFAEDDDEDFSDVFGASESHGEKEESERGSEDGGLMLMSKMSSSSWLGDDEDEFDPFASMDPGWDEMDLEANIARDRHARLAERVEDLVASLKTTEGEDMLSELSEDLVSCHLLNLCTSHPWLTMHAAGAPLGAQRGEDAHHQRTRSVTNPGDSGALYREKPTVHDSTASQGRQCHYTR